MATNDMFQSAMKAVTELDLDLIKSKLMHVESGEGWSMEKANAVEKEYRRFLCLMKMYPDEDTAPLVDVDTFWHYHILDTMKYAIDCQQVFGYFLHHYPYVGMRGENDAQFRLDSGERMRTLYETTFQLPYPGLQSTADIDRATNAEACTFDGSLAWCAGPHDEKPMAIGEGAVLATAWCAGPHTKKTASAGPDILQVATAWCAGPHGKISAMTGARTIDTVTAWCAGPHAK